MRKAASSNALPDGNESLSLAAKPAAAAGGDESRRAEWAQICSDMPAPFLGKPIEICLVTSDADRTMAGLANLGIGPFKVYRFSPRNVHNQTYFGVPAEFELKVCFATQGDMVWEIMEPISGPSIVADHLAAKGDGIHHVAFDCDHKPVEQRIAEFEKRGHRCVQSGVWQGKTGTCTFNFFDTDGLIGACFETYAFSDDWEDPDDVEFFPRLALR